MYVVEKYKAKFEGRVWGGEEVAVQDEGGARGGCSGGVP